MKLRTFHPDFSRLAAMEKRGACTEKPETGGHRLSLMSMLWYGRSTLYAWTSAAQLCLLLPCGNVEPNIARYSCLSIEAPISAFCEHSSSLYKCWQLTRVKIKIL
jgi:hypothetical protein